MNPQDQRIRLEWLDGRYAVCRLAATDPLPQWANPDKFKAIGKPALLNVTRTDRELSIVIEESQVPSPVQAQRGFAALRIMGTMDFSLVGILAQLTTALADANLPVFAISTFDTDVLLVRSIDADAAVRALQEVAVFENRRG